MDFYSYPNCNLPQPYYLLFIYSLIYSPLYSRKDTHRMDLLKDCFHLVCITSCIYLLLSLLNCIYGTSALLVPCFRNEGNIFKEINSPETLYQMQSIPLGPLSVLLYILAQIKHLVKYIIFAFLMIISNESYK